MAGKNGGTRPGAGRKKGPTRKTLALRARILRNEALSVESTVEAIRRGQNYDIRQLFDAKGNFKAIADLTEEQAWCLAGFELVIKNAEAGDGHTDKVLKVRLIDRVRYVELAAKHQGMLTEKIEVTGVDALIQRLARARQRTTAA